MKILIVTQKIDRTDAILGFMHEWIREFAKQTEGVVAIGLGVGEYELPLNVKVASLGKEGSRLKIQGFRKIQYTLRFWWLIWKHRNEYDAVFVHMNQVYVILGAPIWKLLGKKVSLWYAHGHVPASLHIAEKLTDLIFTSTKSGCRLASKKIRVIGQGIDIQKFKAGGSRFKVQGSRKFNIVTVGRIAASKGVETLVDAVAILKEGGRLVRAEVVGGPVVAADNAYFEQIQKQVREKGLERDFSFPGPVANRDLPVRLQDADLFVNMGKTGSLDKAVPEAMATELPVLTSNEAFLEVLGPYTNDLMYSPGDAAGLASKIEAIMDMEPQKYRELGVALREIVVKDHGLERFIRAIVSAL
ncbi:MAG: glycosyltransferase family 4 protein [Patescibacteria group bacterium]